MIWCICAASLLGILFRPKGVAEWIWACAGAAALIVLRLLDPRSALASIVAGTNVYLFLIGMMLLAELARRAGVFSWLATLAVEAAAGSTFRLFAIVYAVGACVTIVLSNDATAIVLTPAVAVAVRRANIGALPFVYACAFIANAASFVLPISNPANLIVFAGAIPPLGTWLQVLALPALAAIVATFAVLAWHARAELRGRIDVIVPHAKLERIGVVAFGGIVASGIALAITSAAGGPIGPVTFVAAIAVALAVTVVDRNSVVPSVRAISWSILPLVAGLFVLVRGLEAAGTLDALRLAIAPVAHESPIAGIATFGVGTALLTNLTNNLPLGVIAGQALAHAEFPPAALYAAAIGIDLGPNLSLTGSLATILWLVVLRRENIAMNATEFLRVGILVMPPALIAALAILALELR